MSRIYKEKRKIKDLDDDTRSYQYLRRLRIGVGADENANENTIKKVLKDKKMLNTISHMGSRHRGSARSCSGLAKRQGS